MLRLGLEMRIRQAEFIKEVIETLHSASKKREKLFCKSSVIKEYNDSNMECYVCCWNLLMRAYNCNFLRICMN